jgi:hypothetical protein
LSSTARGNTEPQGDLGVRLPRYFRINLKDIEESGRCALATPSSSQAENKEHHHRQQAHARRKEVEGDREREKQAIYEVQIQINPIAIKTR